MSKTFLRPDPTDSEAVAKVKAEFEAEYGVNKETRNSTQWKNLVDKYGVATVCKTDGITKRDLRKKMYGEIKS